MKFNGFNYPKNILDVVVIDGRTVRDFVKPEFFFFLLGRSKRVELIWVARV